LRKNNRNRARIPAEDALLITAKADSASKKVLEAIVARVPPPKGSAENPLQALIFDSCSTFTAARWVSGARDGRPHRHHMKIRLVYSNEVYEVEQLGTLTPKPPSHWMNSKPAMSARRRQHQARGGCAHGRHRYGCEPPASALPGFEAIKPMVFAGLFRCLPMTTNPCADALGNCN